MGRQPIFLGNLQTFGYELLFRSKAHHQSDVTDDEKATAELILNTFTEIGLDKIVGCLPAFINVSQEFLLSGLCFALPRERVVIEILEDVKPTQEVLTAVRQLRDEGYTIALDDFIHSPELDPLVELADIVKVDLPLIPTLELTDHVERLRQLDVKLLAEKVETREEFERCLELGFDYFQGYFLCRPSVMKSSRVSSDCMMAMSAVSKLQRHDISLDEVSEVLATSPTIAYRLLRFVNSAVYGLSQRVNSLSHAVSMLGVRQIRMFVCLTEIVEASKRRPDELVKMVLVRAKMAESLGRQCGHQAVDSFFLVGMLSGLPALLGVTLAQIVQNMPLSDSIKNAIEGGDGVLSNVLNCVLAYERGDWANVECGGLTTASIRDGYLSAVDWANHALDSMV